ncbi:hypothetical protein ACP4OV_020941 [Aristida adscensionis]
MHRVTNHLVLVDGELYQVWVMWGDDLAPDGEDTGYSFVERAGAVRCDVDARTYAEVAAGELDGWAVLVGANETVAVRAGDAPGMRGNFVYLIDGCLEKVACAFNLRTQCGRAVDCELLRRAWPGGPWRSRSPQPVWFVPSYADATARRRGGGSARPSRSSSSSPPQGRHHERAQRDGVVVAGEPSTGRVLKTRRSSGCTIANQTATLMIN